jgi:hypothetical protein
VSKYIQREVSQHAVDNGQKSRQNIVGRPDGNDHQQAGQKVFFKEIFEFFHDVNITDLRRTLQAFFPKKP